MRTLLAGTYSTSGSRSGWGRGEALARQHDARLDALGPMSLVRERGASAAGGSVLCAWTGHLTGVERLAQELGMDPSAAAHEVLALGHRRLGTGVLERLRGAFVLAIWDGETRTGVVATDLMGQCAVFWREGPEGLVFATELRDLLGVLPSRPAPDEVSVVHMLTRPGPPRGRTPYEGVLRLEAGSCLRFDEAGWRAVRHWRPRYEGSLRGSRDELAEALRGEVIAAVERSLDGADRVAVLLSGGIDSSISAAVASKLRTDVRGYSAVFPEHPDVDETDYLDSVVEHTGISTRRFAVEPKGSFAASLDYLRAWETPVPGAGYLLERPLAAEAARDGMQIVLDGQGGDEVFGTTPYVAASDLARGRILKSIRTTQSTPWTSDIASASGRFALWRSAALNPWVPERLFTAVRRLRGRTPPPPAWLSPTARQAYVETIDDDAWKRAAAGPIWWRYMSDLLIDHASGVRCDYLRHRSALHGLETRPPLLDLDLALFALRLPPHLAMDAERDRPLVRDAMKGILPEKVRNRTVKSNLSAFYRDITTGGDLQDVRRVLLDPSCEVYRYVDRELITGLAERPPDDTSLATQIQIDALHACGIVECWLRRQADPASTERLADQVNPASYREFGAPLRAAS